MADTSLFDFSRLKDLDKQNPTNNDPLDTLLDQNNLTKKKLPPGPNSLLRAISNALYFTSNYADEIQQFLFKHLTNLITTDKIPPKLSLLRGNSMLLKDYTSNPHMSGFDKINLELVSSMFKIKIVVYSITEDNYLNAIIINNFHERTIEIVRSKSNHYEPVFSKKYMEKIGFSQNIVLNILDNALNGKSSSQIKDLNNGSYVNFEHLRWLGANRQNNSLNQFRITRGHHKKSLSDTFGGHFTDPKDNQPMKFYDLFTNAKPPEDFLKLIRQRKDTAGSDFSINATFDFMDEPWSEIPNASQRDTTVNNDTFDPINISNRSTICNEPGSTFSIPFGTRPSIPGSTTFFQENVNISEIEKAVDMTPKNNTSMMSPIHYLHTPPPGLTPSRYTQRSFTYTEANSHADVSPNVGNLAFIRGDSQSNIYGRSPPGKFGFSSFTQAQQSNSSPQHSNLYSKRTGNPENLIIPIQTSEGSQGIAYGQEDPNQLSASKEKKKPIILDESKERHTGRLKFFDEAKNYGFIIMDEDGSDIFVHMDDLMKANISKDTLRTIKNGNMLRLSFCCMMYIGKYKKSRKAVDIIIMDG